MQLSNPSQWVRATQTARGTLTSKHGFNDDLFITVKDGDVVHLSHHDYYADEWESDPAYEKMVRVKELVKRECIPEGLVLFEMPESQCNCSNCAGDDTTTAIYMDPIMMLERIEDWDKKNKGKV